jgi:hypothetical protein
LRRRGAEIIDYRLAGAATPGPAVYFLSTSATVPGDALIRRLSDLAGKSICFRRGANPRRNPEGWLATHRLDFVRVGYTKSEELDDAYATCACEARGCECPGLDRGIILPKRKSVKKAHRTKQLSMLKNSARPVAADP